MFLLFHLAPPALVCIPCLSLSDTSRLRIPYLQRSCLSVCRPPRRVFNRLRRSPLSRSGFLDVVCVCVCVLLSRGTYSPQCVFACLSVYWVAHNPFSALLPNIQSAISSRGAASVLPTGLRQIGFRSASYPKGK